MTQGLLLAALLLSHWELAGESSALMVAVLGTALLRERAWLASASKVLWWFGILIVIGSIGFIRHPTFDAAKDLWYFGKPLVEIAFGIWVALQLGLIRSFWVLLVGAAIASGEHVVHIASALPEYLANGTNENRVQFGPGSFLSLLPLVVLAHPGLRRLVTRQERIAQLALNAIAGLSAVSLALSRSRTLAVVGAVFLLLLAAAWIGRSSRRRLAAGVALAFVLGIVVLTRPDSTGLEESGFVDKALEEVAIGEYANDEEVALHWRGFESFLALQQFGSFGPVQKILGGGFGQNVPLDTVRSLAEELFEEIPLLHNGYLYVLVKTGLLGLVVFCGALWALWRFVAPTPSSVEPRDGSLRLLGSWLVLSIVASTAVITGPFNRSEMLPVMVLCGVLGEAMARRRSESEASGEGLAIVEGPDGASSAGQAEP